MILRNNWKLFFIVASIISALYITEHIISADWVYEDSTWENGGAKAEGTPMWRDYQMPSAKLTLTNIPNRSLVSWTFYPEGYNAVAAHSVNLVIHILNGLILAVLINSWLGPGWIVGSLFIANPMTTQGVAYAAGRSESFGLLALLGVLWFASASKGNKLYRWTGLLVCAYSTTMIKPTLIVIVGPIVIWTYFTGYKSKWLSGLGFELTAALIVAVSVLSYKIVHRVDSLIPIWRWFVIQVTASWVLMLNGIVPIHLSIDHAWWTLNPALQIIAIIALFLSLLLFSFVLLFHYNASDMIVYGLGWFWIAVSPRLIMRDHLGWIREHHIYIPLVGISIALGYLLAPKDAQTIK